MFWGSGKRREAFETRVIFRDWSRLRSPEECDDPLLGSLILMLRHFGRYAFDTEETRREDVRRATEEWISHVAEGAPAPGSHSAGDSSIHWDEICDYFEHQRKTERTYVVSTLKGFRSLVWDFIQEINRSLNDDRSSSSGIRGHLHSLESSVESGNLVQIRHQILQTVRTIRESIAEREKKQVEQMMELGRRLREMRAELVDVRNKMATDPLTGLYNRHSLDEQLDRVVQYSNFSGTSPCLFIVDADDFKTINDQFGHQAGDAALKLYARACIRSFPRDSDYIARFGGDEFSILVDECQQNVCEMMGRRLLEMIGSSVLNWKGAEVELSASAGAAIFQASETAESWFNRADQALLEAKRMGKNNLVIAPGAETPPA